MNVEQKKALEKAMRENYIVVRDEDGELLCLLTTDEDYKYAAYVLEQYTMTKDDIEQVLDRASGVSIMKKVEEPNIEE